MCFRSFYFTTTDVRIVQQRQNALCNCMWYSRIIVTICHWKLLLWYAKVKEESKSIIRGKKKKFAKKSTFASFIERLIVFRMTSSEREISKRWKSRSSPQSDFRTPGLPSLRNLIFPSPLPPLSQSFKLPTLKHSNAASKLPRTQKRKSNGSRRINYDPGFKSVSR